jgi:hypothetical protein
VTTINWIGNIARTREKKNAYGVLIGKLEGNSLGRSGRRFEDIIKMDLRGICWSFMDWINRAKNGDQWRSLVKTEMHFAFP